MEPSAHFSRKWIDAALELLGENGVGITLPFQGGSMVPTLTAGQRLAVEFSPDRLSRGDVLLFRQSDLLVVHRMLGRTRFPDGRPGLRTRGDGNPNLDPRVDPSQVIGRVVAIQEADGATWWDLRAGRARLYALALSWHNLFWAAAGVAAGPLRGGIARLDRGLLRCAHRLCFRLCHPRTEPPAFAHPAASGS